MCWWHAARPPEPPYADTRRHPGVNRSIPARAPQGNRPPELSTILSLGLWRSAWRSQSCSHTPIRTAPVSLHRNLPLLRCCDDRLNPPSIPETTATGPRSRGVLGRPVKPGDDTERFLRFETERAMMTG